MSRALSRGVQILCLVFGTVEALGAALWCVGGAGIYGSPLSGMRGPELAHAWAFLLMGPFSAFPAAVIVLRKPRWGAAWLIGGGVGAGVLAVPYIYGDAFIFPLAAAPLPMYLLGRWLLRAATDTGGAGAANSAVDSRGGLSFLGSVLVGALLFLAGAIGIFFLFYLLSEATRMMGLRGELLRELTDNYHEYYEHQGLTDGVVLLLLVAGVALASTMRKRLPLRVEALAGMWLELLVVGLALLLERRW